MIQFANIYWLLLIPIILVIFLKPRRKSRLKFSSHQLFDKSQSKLRFRYRVGHYLILLSMMLLSIAMARPQTEKVTKPNFNEGIDIALVLDVSGSMESVDFEPSRLEVAKDTALDFVSGRTNDRMGFVVFAGSAYTKVPLTYDHHILEASIESVETDSVREEGTAIGMALSVGINRLKKSDAASKVIILVTDGDNNAGAISPQTASDLASDLGIKVYSIGVGTDKMILPVNYFGKTVYQEYEGGLNEALLESIAETTGGRYYRAKDEKTLTKIFEEINELEKTEFEEDKYREYIEHSYLLMIVAIIVLVMGVYLDRYRYIQIP